MTYAPETEAQLRKLFRGFNRFMLSLWRLGLGGYGNPSKFGGAVMVIKHRGRKSGLIRYAPVNFAEVEPYMPITGALQAAAKWDKPVSTDTIASL